MHFIQRNITTTISVTLTVDGVATEPAPDSATVTVYREDGTELIAETAATDADDDGLFTYELTPAHTADLDVLRAVWVMSLGGEEQTLTTHHEVVGGFLCSLEQISAMVSQFSATVPTAAELSTARDRAEGFLEDTCGVALRPRYARERINGDSADELRLSRQPLVLIAATVDGTALTSEELDGIEVYDSGVLYREARWTSGRRNVEIKYEHGYQTPPPEADRIAAKLARFYLQRDLKNYDERATRIDTEDGSYGFLVTPGVRGAHTSIPEVNRFIDTHTKKRRSGSVTLVSPYSG